MATLTVHSAITACGPIFPCAMNHILAKLLQQERSLLRRCPPKPYLSAVVPWTPTRGPRDAFAEFQSAVDGVLLSTPTVRLGRITPATLAVPSVILHPVVNPAYAHAIRAAATRASQSSSICRVSYEVFPVLD